MLLVVRGRELRGDGGADSVLAANFEPLSPFDGGDMVPDGVRMFRGRG